MLIVKEKVKIILQEKGLTQYKLAKLIEYSNGALASMINGRDKFPEHVIEKIAPILEVSIEEIKSWIVADKYSKEVIELAIKAQIEKQDDKLILTIKLDEVLKLKNLSRTALSKLIKYSQGGLNEMIIGKEPMSKSVISKISKALDIAENNLISWIIADKYSLQVLELAVKNQIE